MTQGPQAAASSSKKRVILGVVSVVLVLLIVGGTWVVLGLRDGIHRVVLLGNMVSIKTSRAIYWQDHPGAAINFEVLEREGSLEEPALRSPRNPDGGRSIALISGLKADDPPGLVVAYEDFPGQEDFAIVLFNDGRSDFIRPLSKVEELVAKTREYLRERESRDESLEGEHTEKQEQPDASASGV